MSCRAVNSCSIKLILLWSDMYAILCNIHSKFLIPWKHLVALWRHLSFFCLIQKTAPPPTKAWWRLNYNLAADFWVLIKRSACWFCGFLCLLQCERKSNLALEINVLKVKLQRCHAYVPWRAVITYVALAKRIWMFKFILFVGETAALPDCGWRSHNY